MLHLSKLLLLSVTDINLRLQFGEAGNTSPEIIYFILFWTYIIRRWNLPQAQILYFWSFSLIFSSMDNLFQFGFIFSSLNEIKRNNENEILIKISYKKLISHFFDTSNIWKSLSVKSKKITAN